MNDLGSRIWVDLILMFGLILNYFKEGLQLTDAHHASERRDLRTGTLEFGLIFESTADPESQLTDPPGHLWRDTWTALSGPLSILNIWA